MTHADLEAALLATIDDRRVTRSERKALRALIEDDDLDPHERNQLRARAFDIARETIDAPRAKEVLDWLQDVLGLLVPLEGRGAEVPSEEREIGAWFSPGHEPLNAIITQMRRARRSVDVCVFTITDDRISDGLIGLANRGVQVRVISDDDKANDLGSDLGRLEQAGVAVAYDRSDAHMHHKFALFDDARLLTGSFNWTRAASGENHENVLVTSEPVLVAAYKQEFERLWGRYAGR
ncbi:MAG: phospholipase D-like domain-containing protein [Planctomycetota bacterium]|nr:phospholipase D-like domain-containing protein [Planctomycetota bacterium]